MIDYRYDDDSRAFAEKTNVNLRRLSARTEQRMELLNSNIKKLRKDFSDATGSLSDLRRDIDENTDNIDGIVNWIRQLIGQLLPVGACIVLSTSLDPNSLPLYNDGMSWTRVGQLNLTNTYDVWERTA